jgi:hypothetical protein
VARPTGIAGLREILLAALPEPDVKQQAAIMLARHASRCWPERSSSASSGSSRTTAATVKEVRAALRDGPEFTQPDR